MFSGFTATRVPTDGATIDVVHAGSGPAVLLLHGFPQTKAMWSRVAEDLAADHTVVALDLRGYGDSSRPADGEDHAGHSFRAMAADAVAVMTALGHERFTVLGHDRGARVTHRLCLDHPEQVERAAVLDVLPTRHVLATTDRVVAQAYYHWFFLTQPEPLPETLVGSDPGWYLDWCLASMAGGGTGMTDAARAEYRRAAQLPGSVHAWCEDYRAAASVDQVHDEADAAAGRVVTVPLLVLWGTRGLVGLHSPDGADPLEVWRRCADDVRGHVVEGGHFLVEDNHDDTLAALRAFLAEGGPAAAGG